MGWDEEVADRYEVGCPGRQSTLASACDAQGLDVVECRAKPVPLDLKVVACYRSIQNRMTASELSIGPPRG